MKPSELKEKTPAELKKLMVEWKEEYFGLVIKKSTNQLEKTHRLRELRKDIARVMTLNSQSKAKV